MWHNVIAHGANAIVICLWPFRLSFCLLSLVLVLSLSRISSTFAIFLFLSLDNSYGNSHSLSCCCCHCHSRSCVCYPCNNDNGTNSLTHNISITLCEPQTTLYTLRINAQSRRALRSSSTTTHFEYHTESRVRERKKERYADTVVYIRF